MRRFIIACAVLGGVLGGCASEPARSESAVEYVLASGPAALAPFVADDEYMQALTASDLSIRLHRTDNPSVADLRAQYTANVRTWNAADQARLEAAFARIVPRLAGLEAWLPDQILVVKVTPEFESGLPHTRGAAISMGAQLPQSDAELDETLLHETFHVLSRAHPERRDALYAAIGFVRCAPMELPEATRARLITNPDAPLIEHAAPISETDPSLLATPVLVADPPAYDPAKPNLFDYFHLSMQPLRRDESGRCTPTANRLTDEQMRAAIFAHAGRNTNYLFHPEELLADNFAQMMMARADAPNPEIYDRLAAALGIARPRP